MGGYIIPRDADQQHDALAQPVERADLREGDLVFFGHPKVTHVGMALDKHTVIHAEGRDFHRVMINSLDPAAELYSPRLDEDVYGIKRVMG
jgi:cell wall-associated NlpC family hydrolase